VIGHRLAALVLIGGIACGAGCESSSGRDAPGPDYAAAVFSMSGPSTGGASPTTGPAQPALSIPIKLSVTQLGELSPPQWALERLRKDSAVFASVEIVPSSTGDRGDHLIAAQQPTTVPTRGERMRRYAGQAESNYLFVYGSTVDHSINSTSLSVADLTVIGAFVVPGQKVSASAIVTGSLIEVASGRVIFTISADQDQSKLSPAAQRDADEEALIRAVRKQAIAALLDRLEARVKEIATAH
jgi:hypothetical protein